ncbi:hypothetical protein EVAR_55022_1 [Eumeta japonica]|uniref:Uncharacterized protein n=1 Tax=Eumeta variegata TaxID=151549 RepID=A0A4C1YB11_EUMVA|nr:hypothetical protein EVAR_55022_1 [Eumeta japonica]
MTFDKQSLRNLIIYAHYERQEFAGRDLICYDNLSARSRLLRPTSFLHRMRQTRAGGGDATSASRASTRESFHAALSTKSATCYGLGYGCYATLFADN